MTWQPNATAANLQLRAEILKKIRAFFEARHILEVETPLLSRASNTSPYILSLKTAINLQESLSFYLQTSPEFCMKRLLASGLGSIYQICKAFRDAEVGSKHNPEFTILEWYRIDFDHKDLMTEMDEFLQTVADTKPAIRMSYREVFEHYLGIDPHPLSTKALAEFAFANQIFLSGDCSHYDKDTWLDLLMNHCIEPQLGKDFTPIFIYDYPASQAALAKIRSHDQVAERFEVYLEGIELANGFHELADANEQRHRFEAELQARAAANLESIPLDENFLAALAHGLPNCAGVALGIDRLVMLVAQAQSIAEVLSFAVDRA